MKNVLSDVSVLSTLDNPLLLLPAGWGCDAAQQQHPAASDQTHLNSGHHFHIISEGDYLDTVAAQPFPLTHPGTAVVDLAWLQ